VSNNSWRVKENSMSRPGMPARLTEQEKEANMSARKKLNSAYVGGSLVISGMFGLMAQSWAVFVLVLIVVLAFHFYEGNIRIDKDLKPPLT
jgi:hypothetical protein